MIELKDFPNYFITKEGDIYSTKIHSSYPKGELRKLKFGLNTRGYPMVILGKNGKRIGKLVHRLLALQFLPNPENKPCVNHINGVKTDYKLENLEWVTQSENALHAHRIGLCAKITSP